MEFPGSFTSGLQNFEAKTSELNFPVSFTLGLDGPDILEVRDSEFPVSCFLRFGRLFFAPHRLPHFILKSGFLLV